MSGDTLRSEPTWLPLRRCSPGERVLSGRPLTPHLELPGIQGAMLVCFSGVGHVARQTLGREATKQSRAFESALLLLG